MPSSNRKCVCPLPAAISSISSYDCDEVFGLVNKGALRRFNTTVDAAGALTTNEGQIIVDDTDGRLRLPVFLISDYNYTNATLPVTVAANPITDIASWESAIGASDITKIQITPFFSDTAVTGSQPISVGGNDNSTPDGRPVVVGEESVTFTALFKDVPSSIIAEMRDFACEKNLGIFLVDENRQLILEEVYDFDGTTLIGYDPVSIFQVFVGTKQFGGRTDQNSNQLQFFLDGGWDDKLAVIDPTFDFDLLSN